MKTNKKTNATPIEIFTEAATKHFKCAPEDIIVTMDSENTEAFVVYKNEGYRINTRKQLREYLEFQLTDEGAAQHIDYHCWIEATKNTVSLKRILPNLVRKINDTEEAMKVLIAIGIGSYSEDDYVTFWEILSRIDETGLVFGNAIVATAQIYNGAGLVDDLLELQISHGDSVYNLLKDGIFETIYTGDEQSGYYLEFFIYSAEYPFND